MRSVTLSLALFLVERNREDANGLVSLRQEAKVSCIEETEGYDSVRVC